MRIITQSLLAVLFFGISLLAQQASDYFPSSTGYTWNYKFTPLDSVNNEIDSIVYYGIDSFAVVENYKGRSANIILSKTGTLETLPFMPYLDSSFLSFSGMDGYEYFRAANLSAVLAYLDSLGIDSSFSFLGLFSSLEAWYDTYRFGSSLNTDYLIYSKDTSVTINTLDVPLRFKASGKRLEDENIDTRIGSFLAKKFLITRSISYLLIIPPLPAIEIPILSSKDTLWIAPQNWVLKEVIPSTLVDLSILGYDTLYIPGLITEIIQPITDVNEENFAELNFTLSQNYPNPFNPSTTIYYNIPNASQVKLKVYDVLGREIIQLVNGFQSAGSYKIVFDSNALPKNSLTSGVYFYTIQYGNLSISRKMILLK